MKKCITHLCMHISQTQNLWLWPKCPPLAFSVAEMSVAEMSGPKRPRPKCPWPKCPSTVESASKVVTPLTPIVSPPPLVRVFSDVLVAFLYFVSGKYQNMEKPLKYQRRLGLHHHQQQQSKWRRPHRWWGLWMWLCPYCWCQEFFVLRSSSDKGWLHEPTKCFYIKKMSRNHLKMIISQKNFHCFFFHWKNGSQKHFILCKYQFNTVRGNTPNTPKTPPNHI